MFLQIWGTCIICTDVYFLQWLSTTFFYHVRSWHLSLNPRKLIAVKFSHLTRNMTMQWTLKLFKLPDVSIRKFIYRSAEYVKKIKVNHIKCIKSFILFSVPKLMSMISALFWMMCFVFIFLNLSYDNMKVKSFFREKLKISKSWFYDMNVFPQNSKTQGCGPFILWYDLFSSEYENTGLSSIYPCWCPGVF